MTTFSQDRDILKYEPILFKDIRFPSQVLSRGKGDLDGTVLSIVEGDLISSGIKNGMVVYIHKASGQIDGCYEIVSVDSANSLSLSVLRADGSGELVGVECCEDVEYVITTYEPQAAEAGFELTRYFGIRPGRADSEYSADDILDVNVLRQVSVFAVIAGVYASLSGSADKEDMFWQKSLYYQGRFYKARENCRVAIDIGGDGNTEIQSVGGKIKLMRD